MLALEVPDLDLDLDDRELFEDTERSDGAKFCEHVSFICWKESFKLGLLYV